MVEVLDEDALDEFRVAHKETWLQEVIVATEVAAIVLVVKLVEELMVE